MQEDISNNVENNIFSLISKLISEEENAMFVEVPTTNEIKEVVFLLDGEWVPGPNGFTGAFFKAAGDIISADVILAVQDFFASAVLLTGISATNIALIPKVVNPSSFSEFRPISLCNFVNKIFSKLLASQLFPCLCKIISLQQSAFVKGRIILDNVLLAQELISSISKRVRGGNVALKLDMAKANDRVSWLFLLCVLRAFGFFETWIDLI
nr:uncharacterized protein LOC113689345 [Coffea arabica]XP_027062944.1 uncharacterized protein LOC113689359 [Coffea arabica]